MKERERMHSPRSLHDAATIHIKGGKKKRGICFFFCLFLGILCAGCASFPREEVARQGFKERILLVEGFRLFALVREEENGAPWSVFIEGDGQAWASRTRPSADPTPKNPVALRLALRDAAPNRLYLARPCQYEKSEKCEVKYWTSHRFSPEIVRAMSAAIDRITRAAPKHLIGYSGGGAIAALLASERGDVASLTTYAGNLDSAAFSDFHQVSPLTGSMNPKDQAASLKAVPQRHYVGSEDSIVPVSLVEGFIAAQGKGACAELVVIEGADHDSVQAFLERAGRGGPPACLGGGSL